MLPLLSNLMRDHGGKSCGYEKLAVFPSVHPDLVGFSNFGLEGPWFTGGALGDPTHTHTLDHVKDLDSDDVVLLECLIKGTLSFLCVLLGT